MAGKKIDYSSLFSGEGKDIVKGIQKSIQDTTKSIEEMDKALKALNSTQKTLASQAETTSNDLQKAMKGSNSKDVERLEQKLQAQIHIFKQQEDTIKSLNKELSRLRKQQKETTKTVEEDLKAKIEQQEINKKLRKDIRDSIKDKKAEQIQNKKTAKTYDEQSTLLTALRRRYKTLTEEQRNNVNVGGKLLNQVQKLDKELKDLDKSMGNYQRNVGNYEKALSGLKGGFIATAAATGLMIGGVSELVGALSAGFTAFVDFDSAIAQVGVISDATNEEFQMLKNSAKELGASTQFTAGEVANLQIELSKLGFRPDEIINTTGAVLDLATAFGTDLADTATVVAGTLRGLGLDASESGRVADVMAKSFASSALDLEKFKESFKEFSPLAKSANVDLEASSGALGVLADNMISGSKAGTAMKAILLEMQTEGSKLSKELGFTVKSSEDFTRAFDVLSDKGVDASQAVALVGKVAGPSLAILTNNASKVGELAQQFDNASGTSAKFAETIGKTTAGRIAGFFSAVEGVAITLFEKLQPAINLVIDLLTTFFGVLNPVVSKMFEWGGVLADFVTSAFSPLIEAGKIVLNWIYSFIDATGVASKSTEYFSNVFKTLGDILKRFTPLFKALLVGFTTYKATVIATTIAQKAYNTVMNLFTKTTKSATVGVKGLNKAMKANPLGLLIGGLTTVITLLFSFEEELKSVLRWLGFNIEKTKELSRTQKILNEVRDEHTKLVAEEQAGVESLFEELRQENITKKDKKEIVDKINNQYGEYLGNLLSEEASLKDINSAYTEIIKNIELKVGAELKASKKSELITKQLESQAELIKRINNSFESGAKIQQVTGDFGARNTKLTITQTKNYLKALLTLEKQGKTTSEASKEFLESFGILGNTMYRQQGNLDSFRNSLQKLVGLGYHELKKEVLENFDAIKELDVLYPDYNKKIKDSNKIITNNNIVLNKNTDSKKSNKKATDDLLNAEIKRLDLEKRKLKAQQDSLKVAREETKGIGVEQVIARNTLLKEETEIKARTLDIEKRKAELQTNNAINELEAKKAINGLSEAEAINLEVLKDKLVLINKEYRLQLDAMKKAQDAQKSQFIEAPELANQDDINLANTKKTYDDWIKTQKDLNKEVADEEKKSDDEKKKRLDEQIKQQNRFNDIVNTTLNASIRANEILLRQGEDKIAMLDKELARNEKMQDSELQLASLENRAPDLIGLENKRLELLKKRESELKKVQRREEAIQFVEMLNTNLQAVANELEQNPNSKANSATALARTLVDFSLAKAFAQGFHDGGYTGDGGEWKEAGVVHKGEFVVDKKTTQSLGLRNKSMKDFGDVMRNNYSMPSITPLITPSLADSFSLDGKELAKQIGQEVASSVNITTLEADTVKNIMIERISGKRGRGVRYTHLGKTTRKK